MAHREEERGSAAGRLGPAAARHPTTGDDQVFWWTGSDQDRPGGGKGHGEGVRAGQRIPVESVSWCMRIVDSTGYQDLITGSHGR